MKIWEYDCEGITGKVEAVRFHTALIKIGREVERHTKITSRFYTHLDIACKGEKPREPKPTPTEVTQ